MQIGDLVTQAILCCSANTKEEDFETWKSQWQQKIEKFIGTGDKTPETTVFRLVNKLLFNERSNAESTCKELRKLHDSHPDVISQLIPQICNFLLHGPEGPSKSELTRLVYSLSIDDVHMAHRFLFYLRSSSNGAPQHIIKSERILSDVRHYGKRSMRTYLDVVQALQMDDSMKRALLYRGVSHAMTPSASSSAVPMQKLDLEDEFMRGPNFLSELSNLGWRLREIRAKPLRNAELKKQLQQLNRTLPSLAYLPVLNRLPAEEDEDFPYPPPKAPKDDDYDEGVTSGGDTTTCSAALKSMKAKIASGTFRSHAILRLVEEESFCLHSNNWAPFHLVVEVLDFERSLPLVPEPRPSGLAMMPVHATNSVASEPYLVPAADPLDVSPAAPYAVALSSAGENPILLLNANATSSTPTAAAANRPHPATSSAYYLPSQGSHHMDTHEAEEHALGAAAVGFAPSSSEGDLDGEAADRRKDDLFEDDDEDDDEKEEARRIILAAKQRSASASVVKGIFGSRSWAEVKNQVRATSPYGHLPGWRLVSTIVKTCPDLRQEQFAADLLMWFQRVFQGSSKTKKLWLKPFQVLAVEDNCGLVETIPNAVAIDTIKQSHETLLDFFQFQFGRVSAQRLAEAKLAYVNSMAAYSIVTYLLAVRDRHNANILVDTEGHVVHVDFGFMFSNAPGGVKFEPTLFKLTKELLDVMGGPQSEFFVKFRTRVVNGLVEVRRRAPEILNMVRFMLMGPENLSLPCFKMASVDTLLSELEQRLGIHLSDSDFKEKAHSLVDDSIGNWRSTLYDKFQRLVVGIH